MNTDLLKGTLDLLILKILASGQMHGWDITKRLQVVSKERLTLKQGSLYPALHRLENRGWIESEWGVSDAGRSANFYQLTAQGQKQLLQEKEHWQSFVDAMNNVLKLEEL